MEKALEYNRSLVCTEYLLMNMHHTCPELFSLIFHTDNFMYPLLFRFFHGEKKPWQPGRHRIFPALCHSTIFAFILGLRRLQKHQPQQHGALVHIDPFVVEQMLGNLTHWDFGYF